MRMFFHEFWKAASEAPRLYFAPLIGAMNGAWSAVRQSLSRQL